MYANRMNRGLFFFISQICFWKCYTNCLKRFPINKAFMLTKSNSCRMFFDVEFFYLVCFHHSNTFHRIKQKYYQKTCIEGNPTMDLMKRWSTLFSCEKSFIGWCEALSMFGILTNGRECTSPYQTAIWEFNTKY